MKYTKNYKFKKPEPYDTRNINDINDSFDLVDAKLKETQDNNENLKATFEQLTINAGESNAEIVAARRDKFNNKTYNSVPDRLDAVSSLMAQVENKKADKDTIFTMANMGQDIKEAMTGGSVPVVGVNAILKENIVNRAVTEEKTSFLVPYKNLFNENLLENFNNSVKNTNGFTLNYLNSNIAGLDARRTSFVPLPLLASQTYTLSCDIIENTGNKAIGLRYRDSELNTYYVVVTPATSPTGHKVVTFTPTVNVVDMAFYLNDTDYSTITLTNIQIERGKTASEHVPYCGKFKHTPYFLNDGTQTLDPNAYADFGIGEQKFQKSMRYLTKTTYSDGRPCCAFNLNTTSKTLEYKNDVSRIIYHTYGSHFYNAGYSIAPANFPSAIGTYELVLNHNSKSLFFRSINAVNELSDIILGTIYIDPTLSKIYCIASFTKYSIAIDGVPYKNKCIGLKVNCLGDSLTYGYLPPEYDASGRMKLPYPDLLKAELGLAECRNYGITGTCISYHAGYDTATPIRPMCVRYADMDDDADLIVVMGSSNDYLKYHSSTVSSPDSEKVPIGSINDTDNRTFYGGYNQLVQGLIAKYPGKKIILVVPPQNYKTWTPNGLGNTFDDFRKAILNIGIKYSLPVFDVFSELGLSEYNCKQKDSNGNYIYTPDGIHMLQNVVKDMFVPMLANFIRKLYA